MQFSIKWILPACLSVLLLWQFVPNADTAVATNKNPGALMLVKQSSHSFRKTSAPFSTTPSFSWIDQTNGVGRVQVTITGDSFADSSWRYQWNLPVGVSTSDPMSGDFNSPAMNSETTYQIELSGLDPQSNKNIFFQIQPSEGLDQRMVVVVPTHFEQTLEAEASRQYAPELNNHSMQKSVASRRQLPKGIQF